MGRSNEQLLELLRQQMGFLRNSAEAFYKGDFAESLRIATTIRVLVHETGKSKSLLQQVRPGALDLAIPDATSDPETPGEELFRYCVGVRLGSTISPAVDLRNASYSFKSIGVWWNRPVLKFFSRLGTPVTYKRKQVVLILANKEGGAHVDRFKDTDYHRLLNDLPLRFAFNGAPMETPDLARFIAAQSGVEMLACLQANFFPEVDLPPKWEYGTPPPVARYLEQIVGIGSWLDSPYPNARAELRITRRK